MREEEGGGAQQHNATHLTVLPCVEKPAGRELSGVARPGPDRRRERMVGGRRGVVRDRRAT